MTGAMPSATRRDDGPRSMGLPPLLALLAIVLSPFVLITLFQVDIPDHDEWDLTPAMSSWIQGRFPGQAIWAPYGEHRMFIPRLLMLLLGGFSRWSVIPESILSALLLVACLVLVHRWISRGGPSRGRWFPVLTSLLMLAPNRAEAYMWSWQLQVPVALILCISSLVLLDRAGGGIPAVFGSVACAIGASVSFGAGLAVWPVGFLALLVNGGVGKHLRLAIWAAGALAVAVIFSGGGGPGEMSLSSALPYFLVSLGSPVWPHVSDAPLAGLVPAGFAGTAVLAILVAETIRCLRSGRLEPAVLLGLLGATACLAAALGRSGFGVPQAMSLRYVPFSSLAWLCAATALVGARLRGTGPALRRAGIAAIVAGTLLSSVRGVYYAELRAERLSPVSGLIAEGRLAEAADRLLIGEAALRGYLPEWLEIRGGQAPVTGAATALRNALQWSCRRLR